MTAPATPARRFSRRGPRLSTPGGGTVTFPHPVARLLDYGSVAVVLLDAPAGEPRNVYGIDRRGKVLWRLRRSPLHGTGPGRENPYEDVERHGRCVRARSLRGPAVDVDVRSGRIVRSSPWRFAHRGTRLRTPAGKTVTFPHPVGQVVDCGEVAVVRLDAPGSFPRNVYGVASDGTVRWRLQRTPFAESGKRDSYDSIGKRRQGRLVWARSWWGSVYDIEPATGRVVRSYWTK